MEKRSTVSGARTGAVHLARFFGIMMLLMGVVGMFFIHHGFSMGRMWFRISAIFFWAMGIAGLLHVAYRDNDTRCFGKDDEGRVSWIAYIVMLPYVAALWIRQMLVYALWGGNKYDKICDGVWAGRRPARASDLPDGIAACVDLASEFPAAEFLRVGGDAAPKYVSFPILEASVRSGEELCACIDSLPEGAVYIHCAQGHGRTGYFTAALLLRRGIVSTVPQAEEIMRAQRPGIKLRRAQRECLHAFADMLREKPPAS